MKTNIVTLGNTNMSGNQEYLGPDGVLHTQSDPLTNAERQHTDTLLSLFEKHLRGTCSNGEATIELGMGAVRGFLKHVGLPPWQWSGRHLDDFLSYKVKEHDIGYGRQSTYLTYLRSFQNYILEDRGLCNDIHRRFGVQPQRYITKENSIPVKRKNQQRKRIIKPLSAVQCQKMIEEFDIQIKQAKMTHGKAFNTLRRDKVAAMVLLMTGVRVDELVNLKISAFQPDLKYQNFGEYALLTIIMGKGNKTRVVRLYNPLIKEVMDWYIEKVRPAFLTAETDDPDLLFLSERGGALCTEQVRRMLKKIIASAGITLRVTPHLLRHTYATQMANIIGPEALQKQLGHSHLSTTLGTYYHQDPLQVGDQVRQGINNFSQAIDNMTQGIFDENNTN